MIRHVVMWKFKSEAEGKTKSENLDIVRNSLYALVPIINEIKKMEVGFDVKHTDSSMDLMLLTEFDSLESLALYAEHPEHLKVAAYVRKVVESRVVLDCEI
ncbi:MAG: Dabb family protein [Clostridia bacterium]|nr:Dabb family protein [Clostridia bacterium]